MDSRRQPESPARSGFAKLVEGGSPVLGVVAGSHRGNLLQDFIKDGNQTMEERVGVSVIGETAVKLAEPLKAWVRVCETTGPTFLILKT